MIPSSARRPLATCIPSSTSLSQSFGLPDRMVYCSGCLFQWLRMELHSDCYYDVSQVCTSDRLLYCSSSFVGTWNFASNMAYMFLTYRHLSGTKL